jgi:archaeosine-15-forming tRNA-guanine transglycosylase
MVATKIPYNILRSSEAEIAQSVLSEAQRAINIRKPELDRALKNWRHYFAADSGQWDEHDKKILRSEFRHAAQFDVISPKVDALAGALLADLPDTSWTPVEGEPSIVTEAIAESYYSDKELYNYEDVIIKVLRDGLVHAGDAYLYVDRKYGTKRIALGRELPGFLVWDPYWFTDDDRDAEVVYRIRYLNPAKIIQIYEHKSEEIMRAYRDMRKERQYPFGGNGDSERRSFQSKVGDEFRVIEKHYLEIVKGNRLIGRREGSLQWIPFPINKDREYLTMFAELNKIDWDTVTESPYEDRVHYFTAVCSDLPKVALACGEKSEIQVNGLPFYHFTVKRFGGQDMGVVESIIDLQQTINKRESLVTEMLSKAQGGSTLVNQNLFPDEAKRQEWVKNKNKQGHAEFVDLDGVKTPYAHMSASNYPNAVVDQINRMYTQVLPLISRASDALSSITESGDSGILFERKFQLNLIANTLQNRAIRQFMNNIGEGYFYQWQNTYADVERTVTFRASGEKIILNQRGAGGLIYNSVTSTPRCRVVVTENAKSQTYRMRWRTVWAEMLQSIDPNLAPGHYAIILNNFMSTLDLTEDDKAMLRLANEMLMVNARMTQMKNITGLQAGIQGDTLQSAQFDMQLQQLLMQKQGMEQPQQQAPQQGEMPVQLPSMEQMGGGMPPDMNSMPGAPQMPPEMSSVQVQGGPRVAEMAYQ